MFFVRIITAAALLWTSCAPTEAALLLPPNVQYAPSDARWYSDHDFMPEIKQAQAMLATMEAGFTTGTKVIEVRVPIPPKAPKGLGRHTRGHQTPSKVRNHQKPGKPSKHNDRRPSGHHKPAKPSKHSGHNAGYRKPLPKFRIVRHVVPTLDFNILLAVKRFDQDQIIALRIDKSGKNRLGFKIDWARMNGVNTNFIVHKPRGYTVLAIRRVIHFGKELHEVVYTPFSADLDTPTMRAYGMKYLQDHLGYAYDWLKRRRVPSQSFRGRLVTDVIPPKTALVLSIIEHIDPSRLETVGIARLVDEVLVMLAANRENAYAYALSKVGARGLGQFMPDTYARLVRMYPKAHLMKSFVSGATNHTNAIEASLLLFDSDLSSLPVEMRGWLIQRDNHRYAAAFLAASYNCGGIRTARAYMRGGNWVKRLPRETQLYVDKLRQVEDTLRI